MDADGRVNPADVEAAIDDQTVLVTIMHANNETGTLHPIAKIAEIAHQHGALMHTDASQSVGKIPTDVSALGVVTPVNTVAVRSRVDGQLVQVHYVEGQTVHQGDPLVEIDPAPFQASLAQAEGQMARDTALLENARLDLQRYKDAGCPTLMEEVE